MQLVHWLLNAGFRGDLSLGACVIGTAALALVLGYCAGSELGSGLVPNRVTFPFILLALLTVPIWQQHPGRAYAAAAVTAVLLITANLFGWIGAGTVKLALGIALVLGPAIGSVLLIDVLSFAAALIAWRAGVDAEESPEHFQVPGSPVFAAATVAPLAFSGLRWWTIAYVALMAGTGYASWRWSRTRTRGIPCPRVAADPETLEVTTRLGAPAASVADRARDVLSLVEGNRSLPPTSSSWRLLFPVWFLDSFSPGRGEWTFASWISAILEEQTSYTVEQVEVVAEDRLQVRLEMSEFPCATGGLRWLFIAAGAAEVKNAATKDTLLVVG